jgi:hypothetical protein
MTIERDELIRFHEKGTLAAVTRWIQGHDVGLAEWLKNTRRAYQTDRLDVPEEDRVAVILLRDARPQNGPARIGLLDVGGVNAEDLVRWSIWQDPDASRRGSDSDEEQTQGNGGKAYMYRMFSGPARLLGVRDGLLNAKGFDGPGDSVDRGRPGFIPSRAEAERAPTGPWQNALDRLLAPYDLKFSKLPAPVRAALSRRESFTLVEGEDPKDVFEGRIRTDNLLIRLTRHDQSTYALEQMRVFAAHNGTVLFNDEALKLEEIPPYPGFESPQIVPIPDALPDESGSRVSTRLDGTRPGGRLILRTSKDNMPNSRGRLHPRWRVTYRTQHQMIGSKPVSDLLPTTPGSQFVYATVELSALEPDYVTHGRVRPGEGPLMEALDLFVAEHLRLLAKAIYDKRRQEKDEQELDAVAKENQMLDRWKDQFLPNADGGMGSGGSSGRGGDGPTPPPPPPPERGLEPYQILVGAATDGFLVGVGVKLNLKQLLNPRIVDNLGRSVTGVKLLYNSDDDDVLEVDRMTGSATVMRKGVCYVSVRIGSGISSEQIKVEAWAIDHVLLSPRQLTIPLGTKKAITAEVTSDDGKRSTALLLNWKHDADEPLTVRIRPDGMVTGNRLGTTRISAGAGQGEGAVWSRIPATVDVIDNPDRRGRGEGYPQLKVTGRDIDPETGAIREGDAESPALWQEVADVENNIWWLNVDAPEAAFAFSLHREQPATWRLYHAAKLVEMVTQVHMQVEYTTGKEENKDFWAAHKAALERFQIEVAPRMWEKLSGYVRDGTELE